MTNRERYMRAFSVLKPTDDWMEQLEAAEPKKMKRPGRRLITVLAAALLLVGLIGAAYAADVGGIQGQVRIWQLGNLVNMDVKMGWIEDGNGGNPHQGYVFCNEDGDEVFRLPVETFEGKTEEEILEALSDCVQLYANEAADGAPIVQIYYFDQRMDIGDYFDENGYGHYEGEISARGYSQWVEVWRSAEEPWWHFSSKRDKGTVFLSP